jgi:hypothetical protein
MNTYSQVDFYRTNGGEVIFSLADVTFNNNPVNSNLRFTAFFHGQQRFNLDFGKYVGLFTGVGIRNIGFITEDLYQNVGFLDIDNTHVDWNKNVKIKRRSYSVGFPLALKLGVMDKAYLFGGAEIEYMFHYKQKLFIDGEKFKFSEWASDRVNPWIPSFFAGIQLPKGLNIKFKYYLDDFLNPGFTGVDFGENVDYSTFQSSGIWYISIATIISKKSVQNMIGGNTESALP